MSPPINSQLPNPTSQEADPRNGAITNWRLGVGSLKRLIGLDTRAEEYAYAVDPVAGYVSAQKAPDKWIQTTCGYCSVGCGMFIGVRNGRAVAVRGNPDHPVSRGLLCPKGLSEHHTIHATNRATYPLLRSSRRSAGGTKADRNGRMERIAWPDAFETMANRPDKFMKAVIKL